MGFEKLIDLVVEFLEFFRFCTIIDQYERGVRMRFGRFYSVLEPGVHLQLPFYLDKILNENVVAKVHQLSTQAIATADDKAIAVGAVITYEISNIEKALLEVDSVRDAVNDACQGVIAGEVLKATWDEVRGPEFTTKVTAACRKRGWKYGVEILRVTFCELAPVRNYRTITGT